MVSSPTPVLQVKVWRGDAERGAFDQFEVPQQPSQTVLDVVTWIQRYVDSSLSYRFACRVGMCGSCAMMVNGEPRWSCRTHVDKVLRQGELSIAPLRNLPVIKDLVCDMTAFFDKWQRAQGEFEGGNSRQQAVARIDPESPARQAANDAIECINCAICYAACDVVNWQPDYLGPAALNRAWSLQNDERDQRFVERLQAVSTTDGCFNCHSQQGCAAYCPNALNPTASIAGLKRLAARGYLGSPRRGNQAPESVDD